MSKSANQQRWLTFGLGMVLLATATGCQIDVGGQTLPSPYWTGDDVQYFPSGTEFKLSREAAAMQAAKADAAAQGNPNGAAPPGCTTCATANDCNDPARPACNLGFCEVQ